MRELSKIVASRKRLFFYCKTKKAREAQGLKNGQTMLVSKQKNGCDNIKP